MIIIPMIPYESRLYSNVILFLKTPNIKNNNPWSMNSAPNNKAASLILEKKSGDTRLPSKPKKRKECRRSFYQTNDWVLGPGKLQTNSAGKKRSALEKHAGYSF